MLDRVRIWFTDDDFAHYEIKDENGVPYNHSAIPKKEWILLRSKTIKQLRSVAPDGYKFPPGSAFIVDYLVVLSLVAETS